MYLVTTEHMRRLEQSAVDAGATWAGLMEQAGKGVAQEVLRRLAGLQSPHVLVLVGPGNNGGDGLVAARYMHDTRVPVALYIWKRDGLEQDANWQRCRKRAIAETLAADDNDLRRLHELVEQSDVVVDALLGMGGSRPVMGQLARIVQLVNRLQVQAVETARKASMQASAVGEPGAGRAARRAFLVLSVDVPTGIHSDTGAVLGVALRAGVTVATGLAKRGLMLYPGRNYVGRVRVADIGLPPESLEGMMSETLTIEQARKLLPARPADSHKGTFGKVLVVAGSLSYPGAAALATAGAGRVGAGLVTLAAARSILNLVGRSAEVTLIPLPESDVGTPGVRSAEELLKHTADYDALVVGPGLGKEKPTGLFLRQLLGLRLTAEQARVGFRTSESEGDEHPTAGKPHGKRPPPGFRVGPDADEQTATGDEEAGEPGVVPPTVLDADALNLLAEVEAWWEHLPEGRFVLTPHPGEMRRLLDVEELEDDRVQVATDAATRWNQVVVLKGSTTVIAAPDGRSVVHAVGNAALATAGTGDVLAGAIGGFLAQKLDIFDAAVLGVYVHALAGELVRGEVGDAGALAGDVLPRLPRAIKQLKEG